MLSTSVFGTAAFAQPAIGRAFLAGSAGMPGFDADVYGAPLVATAVAGLLLLLAGGICLARALSRAGLRAAGISYAVLLALFIVSGFSLQILQPLAALGMTAAAVVIALRLPRTTSTPSPAETAPAA